MKSFVKVLSGVVTIAIVALLLLVGPANAFITGFTISNPFPELGEITSFLVNAEVETGEQLDIQNFTIFLDGPIEYTCIFDVEGAPLSACPGATITKISAPDYEFGYGFLPGFLKYNFTLDSSVLEAGTYETQLTVALPSSEVKTFQQNLIVQDTGIPVETCSIRAKDGSAMLDESEIVGQSKLSLFVPGGNGADGQGSITAGRGQNRITYDFEVVDATRIDSQTIIFDTSGKLRVGRGNESTENAEIAFNQNTFEAQIVGDSLSIENMDVYFAKC